MRRFFWICLALYLVYAVGISSYLLFSEQPISEQYIGTQADPQTYMTKEQLVLSKELSNWRNIIYFVHTPVEWLFYLFVICSGVSIYLRKWSKKIVKFKFFYTCLYVILLSSLSWIVSLPFKYVSYLLSKEYGISIQPFANWMRENLISFWIGTVILCVITLTIMFLIQKSPKRWWFYTWLLSVPFTLFLMFIQPVVIDPLYHEFSHIQDKELEREILDLAKKANIPAERVYEVKMSDKTNALNAYVTGVGSNLRIVLWDTTLQKLTREEVLFVMAHEMAHYDLNHLPIMLVVSIVVSFIGLYIAKLVYNLIFLNFGKKMQIKQDDLAALPIILLIFSLLSFAFNPVSNFISRIYEYQSDRYAIELTDDIDAAIRTFQKLSVESLSDVNPPSLVKIIRYTHPPMVERMTKIKELHHKKD